MRKKPAPPATPGFESKGEASEVIPAHLPGAGLTRAQLDEAERRLLEYERNPYPCASWEEVKSRLESKGW